MPGSTLTRPPPFITPLGTWLLPRPGGGMPKRHPGGEVGSMSVRVWDITLIVVALCAAGASAWYYVAAVVDRDRPLARMAGAAFFLFTTAALVYFWKFW